MGIVLQLERLGNVTVGVELSPATDLDGQRQGGHCERVPTPERASGPPSSSYSLPTRPARSRPLRGSHEHNHNHTHNTRRTRTVTQPATTSRIDALCLDANDPHRQAQFWAAALGWEIDESDGEIALTPTDGTRFGILFEPTPEKKTGQNNIHLDLTSTSLEDQHDLVDRLIGLGARHVDIGQSEDEGHVVLADPEGNEFCIIEPHNQFPGRLWPSRSDQRRWNSQGRPVLERSARLATGLGSGRRNCDPGARRHRSTDHMERTAADAEARQEPAPSRHRCARSRRSPGRRSTVSSNSERPGSISDKATSAGWSWPTPTTTSSAC